MAEQNSSISSFKQFLLRILLPLALAVGIGGVVFDHFFEKKLIFSCELCGAYKVNRILTETHPDEIPIFGSSRVEGGYIPDSLGTNFFNYGLSGSRFDVMLFFAEQECRKKKNNPWMILGLDLTGVSSALGDIANYIPNSGYASVRALMDSAYKPYYSVPLVKYYGRFENYYRAYLNNRMQLTKAANKGASLQKNELTTEQFDALVEQRENAASTFTINNNLKNRLLQLLAANPNRTFVFVVAPYHASFYTSYTNLDEAYKFMNLLRSYKNVRVFDFGKMPLPDDMYFNTSHINYKGAIRFNEVLRDSLLAAGIR